MAGWFDQNAPTAGRGNTGVTGGGGNVPPFEQWAQQQGISGEYARAHLGEVVDKYNAATGAGIKVAPSTHPGDNDTIINPDGSVRDMIRSDNSWQNIPDDPGTGPGGAGGANAYLGDPSYQFTYDQALQGAQRSAAGKGTLLTGGFQKALGNYLGGVASQGYDAQFKRLFGVSQLGADMAARQAQANQTYANAANEAQTGKGNAAATGSINQGNVWGDTAQNVAQAYNQYRLFGPAGTTRPNSTGPIPSNPTGY